MDKNQFTFDNAQQTLKKADKDIAELKQMARIKEAGKDIILRAMQEAKMNKVASRDTVTDIEEKFFLIPWPADLMPVVQFIGEQGFDTEFMLDEINVSLGNTGPRFPALRKKMNSFLSRYEIPYRLSARKDERVTGVSEKEKHFSLHPTE